MSSIARLGARRHVALLGAFLALGLGAWFGSDRSAAAVRPGAHAAAAHPTVNVLYAGSLENVMNNSIIPAFQRATGYQLNGYPAGSKELAQEIKGGVRPADVFISASAKVNKLLMGARNGNWVSWYVPFATTSLVLGYNPNSSFAQQLRSKPWYEVVDQAGFRLGFTDPALDPKGVLAVAAMKEAASRYDQPALNQVATDQSDLFPEEDLVGRLQSGQLDAGFFYTVEASAAKIKTVSLGPVKETAGYTVTVVNRANDETGGEQFIRFLLGPHGRSLLKAVGLTIDKAFKTAGSASQVPYLLRTVVKP